MATIIPPKQSKIVRTIRLKPDLDEKLNEIAQETGQTKTRVIEHLLLAGIKAYEKEKAK